MMNACGGIANLVLKSNALDEDLSRLGVVETLFSQIKERTDWGLSQPVVKLNRILLTLGNLVTHHHCNRVMKRTFPRWGSDLESLKKCLKTNTGKLGQETENLLRRMFHKMVNSR